MRLGLLLEPAAEDRLMNQYRHLSSFPENREVLAELKARGIQRLLARKKNAHRLHWCVSVNGAFIRLGLVDH